MSTITWQKIEGALVFIAVISAIYPWDHWPWWLAGAIFFSPDIAIVAYLGGSRFGAAVYNLLHIYGLGLGLMAVSYMLPDTTWLFPAGSLVLGHAGFDRMLGYGLKETSGFHDTHLGRIGRRA